MGARGETREQPWDSTLLTKKPSNPARLHLTPTTSVPGWFQKPESASEASPGQPSCLQQILSKKIRRKEKQNRSDVIFTRGTHFAVGRGRTVPLQQRCQSSAPTVAQHLTQQCQKLELSSRIQPIFEASHLLLHA